MCKFLLTAILLFSTSVFGQELPLRNSITQYGITWTFSGYVPVGQFVNGDYYVVGPFTITSITPAPVNGRNGSVRNLPPDQNKSGFDNRVSSNRYDQTLRANLPINMVQGDALISTISVDQMNVLPAPLRPSDKAISPVQSASVLTCLAQAVPSDAFRPSYCDRTQKIYLSSNLHRELLPNLSFVYEIPNIREWEDRFQRPWLDVCFFGFDAAIEYQPHYGREVGRAVGIASLMLMLNYPDKEKLLINVVQYGIDLWGIVRAGYPGWQAHGGHGTGRKWPIIFAGIMLGDEDMQSPKKKFPNLKFGDDMQTMYGRGWTGATALYAGHIGRDGNSYQAGWGAYEHLHPSLWIPYDGSTLGESYRRCCTSLAWVGQALAIQIMNAEKIWNHDAFIDYIDRWMTEDDTEFVAEIKRARGWDFSASWARQGQAWDSFVEQMWHRYWKKPSPTDTLEFGNVKLKNSTIKEFTIKNLGTSNLIIGDILCPDGFGVDKYNFSISSGDSNILHITFTPTSEKQYAGNIIILNSDYTNYISKISVNGSGTINTGVDMDNSEYKKYSLYQNYPNPFNPKTNIKFTIPKKERVILKIYNILGVEVLTLFDSVINPDSYTITLDLTKEISQKFSSGIYLYKLQAGNFTETKKMVFLK